MQTSRRTLLAGGAGLAAGATLPRAGRRPTSATTQVHADPFTLGVASGDPWPDGFVLWTRLAPDPLAEDGLGGLDGRPAHVLWQVSEDRFFSRVVARGSAEVSPSTAYAAHVEVRGLRPGREYWYRFRTGRWFSRVGRTLTSPAPSTLEPRLTMVVASCSQLEHGFFTAYRRMAEEQPDLVLHLGDYVYECAPHLVPAGSGDVREHVGGETFTLADYRRRHAQYKTDSDLQEAHAAAPWLVVWDDHEISNNWAANVPDSATQQEGFAARRWAAMRAYAEHLPLRRTSMPSGGAMRLHRRLAWGRLANLHLLDTRQYRDDQACGDGNRVCPQAAGPRRTMTGDAQERWLLDGLRRSRARWDVLGQQVFFSRLDRTPTPDLEVSMDHWDGYPAARDRLVRGWIERRVRNPVVLTGDVHSSWAAQVTRDFGDREAAPVGVEFVCSSITSRGDGEDTPDGGDEALAHNAHLDFFNDLRGYLRATLRPDRMEVDFRALSYVSRPGAPVFTRRSYLVADGDRTLHRTADHPSV